MEIVYKEVYYEQYCSSCKHKDLAENEKPCRYCLAEPINLYSHKPTQWEEADG